MSVDISTFGNIGTNFLDDTFSQARQEMQIKELLTPSDGQGGFEKIWVTCATVNGFMFQYKADEPMEAGRKVTAEMFKIHIEPFSGLNEKMKLTINNEDYIIHAIDDIAKIGQWYVITAEKGKKE